MHLLRYYDSVKFCTAILALPLITGLVAQTGMAQAPPPAPAPPPASTAPAVSSPADPNKVVLTVGATKITAAQYEATLDSLPAQYQAFARGPGKRQFAEQMVQLRLLADQAEKMGLDKDAKVQQQLAFQRQDLLARAMFEKMQQNVKVDDAAIQTYYDGHKNEYETVKAKHILIRVKGAPMPGAEGKPELTDEQALAKAQSLRAKLQAGGDFAALAKAESDDTGSGAQGGELGEFHRGMMVPAFEQAAFTLKPGEVSEPIKTQFGYHLIVVENHNTKPLAEMKPDIEKALRPESARKEIEAARSKATVQIDDAYFGPATAPEAAPQAPVKQ